MKRDMDLVREILRNLDEAEYSPGWYEVKIDGRTDAEIGSHIQLLADAGLVLAEDLRTSGAPHRFVPKRLTWEGHEFIEAAKDEGRWEKAKKIMVEKGGGFAFPLLKTVLMDLMKRQIFGDGSQAG